MATPLGKFMSTWQLKGTSWNFHKFPGMIQLRMKFASMLPDFDGVNDIVNLVGQTYILRDDIDDDVVHLWVCKGNEWVCHNMENSKLDFFFVYYRFFTNLFMCVLFKNFQVGVMRELNVVPT